MNKEFLGNRSTETSRYSYEVDEETDETGGFNLQLLPNHTSIDELRRQLFSSDLSGNFFMGPEPYNRGPFLPHFDRRHIETVRMLSFEFESAPILGQEHYQELLSLFKRLIDYVGMDPERANPVERYLSGVEIYISMMTTFSSYETPSMNIDQWEERTMTEEELSRLDEWKRDNYRGRKFWAIKKSFTRTRRSETQKEETCYSLEELSKQRWSELIVYMMSAFLQAGSAGEFIVWSDNFARLYLRYRAGSSLNIVDDCLNKNFDTFLYSKISRMQDWSNCVHFSLSEKPDDWCQAWRRIMLNYNNGISKPIRPRKFHQDLKTLIDWLSDKIFTKSSIKSVVLKNHLAESRAKNIVCYKNTSSLACPNTCRSFNFHENSSLSEDISYERKWTFGHSNVLKCQCPEDNLNITADTNSSDESFLGILKNFWEAVLSSPCEKNSPTYDSPRCTDLR